MLHESGGIRIFYDERLLSEDSLPHLEELPELLRRLPAQRSRSRHMNSVWELDAQDWFPHAMIARQHVHGGIIGGIAGPLRTLFLDPAPMIRELQIARHLLHAGIPASRPLALRLRQTAGPFFTAMLVSEEIGGAVDLLRLCRLTQEGDLKLPAPARRKLLEKTAVLIAGMHDNRVYHGDLNLKNILVSLEGREVGDEIYIIDFKKAKLCRSISVQKGMKNVNRLWRSIRKWRESAAVFKPADHGVLKELYSDARAGAEKKQ